MCIMNISPRFRTIVAAVVATAGIGLASSAQADSGTIRFYVYKAAFNQYRYAYGAALSLLIFLLLGGFTLYLASRAKAQEGAY